MRVVATRAELAEALDRLPDRRLVPTMGALHAGHAALLAAAGPGAVVSIFVNPLQFDAAADLDRYPRTLDADLALCAEHKAAVVWAPSVEDVYPAGRPTVTVSAGPLGAAYEGASRPGHFDGMLTVVAKLLGIVGADAAWFGQKDAQQLALVRRMVADLELGVAIHEVPTVRDADGLALSSRNVHLSSAERAAALALPRSVLAGSLEAARAVLADAPGLELDYLDLVDTATFTPASSGRLIVAARVGSTRLIDNAPAGGAAETAAPATTAASAVRATPPGPAAPAGRASDRLPDSSAPVPARPATAPAPASVPTLV